MTRRPPSAAESEMTLQLGIIVGLLFVVWLWCVTGHPIDPAFQ